MNRGAFFPTVGIVCHFDVPYAFVLQFLDLYSLSGPRHWSYPHVIFTDWDSDVSLAEFGAMGPSH
jgi:hypothetical protein